MYCNPPPKTTTIRIKTRHERLIFSEKVSRNNRKGDDKMAKTKKKISPARTPEEQEQRMINLAMKQAEQMLMEGRAPSQIVTHYLKLATEKSRLENEKLRAETRKALSQADSMDAQVHSEEVYQEAIQAFKSYVGKSVYDEDEYYDD